MSQKTVTAGKEKLHIIFRVEPGCLGPKGDQYVQAFCVFAQQEIANLDADIIHWQIIPRADKGLPELEYAIKQKRLKREQAGELLKLLGRDIDDVEALLEENITELIEQFFENQKIEPKHHAE